MQVRQIAGPRQKVMHTREAGMKPMLSRGGDVAHKMDGTNVEIFASRCSKDRRKPLLHVSNSRLNRAQM
jgi:hypothetical protein